MAKRSVEGRFRSSVVWHPGIGTGAGIIAVEVGIALDMRVPEPLLDRDSILGRRTGGYVLADQHEKEADSSAAH